MLDEQAECVSEALAGALRAASFGPFHFVHTGERYNHTQVRQLHAYALRRPGHPRPRDLYSIEVCADAATFANLVAALEAPLSAYINAESRRFGFLQTVLTLDEFALATIRAAAITSPEEVAAALQQWAAGVPWVYSKMFTVTGITVESPLHVSTGVTLKRLPMLPHELRQQVPSWLVEEESLPMLMFFGANMLGATVLCAEEHYSKVFWPEGKRPSRWTRFAVFFAARAVHRLQRRRRDTASVAQQCAPSARFQR